MQGLRCRAPWRTIKNPENPLTDFSFEGDTPGECRQSGDMRDNEPQKLTGHRVLMMGQSPGDSCEASEHWCLSVWGCGAKDHPEWLRKGTVSQSWGLRQGVRASQGLRPLKPAQQSMHPASSTSGGPRRSLVYGLIPVSASVFMRPSPRSFPLVFLYVCG